MSTSEFTPSTMLKRYLEADKRDMYDIVGALMGYINADPTFKTTDFDQAVQYVLNHGVEEKELFAPFDEKLKYEQDPSKWDEEYYAYARVYLKENFCKKRIEHVKAVAQKLYLSNRAKGSTTPVKTKEEENSNKGKKFKSQQREVKQGGVVTLIVIVAVVVILLAVIVKVIAQK